MVRDGARRGRVNRTDVVRRDQRYRPFTSDNDHLLPGWSVPRGEFHLFSSQEANAGGSQAGNLTGANKATITQAVDRIVEGTRYRLTWRERTETWEGCEIKPPEHQQYIVSVTGQRSRTYTPTDSWQPPEPEYIDFTATGDTTVTFASASSDHVAHAHCGALITGVSLRELRSGNS